MKTIPYTVKAKDTSLRIKRPIPYTIIQTMKTNVVPDTMYNASQSWINLNPEYDYEFFDDDRCLKFIKDHYNNNIVTKFKVINIGAARADFFRWLYLAIYGGFYLDIDSVCLKPIRQWSNLTCFLNLPIMISRDSCVKPRQRINHMLLVVPPRHPLLDKAIRLAVATFDRAFREKNDIKFPQDLCGPGILAQALDLFGKTKHLKFIKNRRHGRLGNMLRLRYHSSGVVLLSYSYLLSSYFVNKYKQYDQDISLLKTPRYGQEHDAFNYQKCLLYLQKNNLTIDGQLLDNSCPHYAKINISESNTTSSLNY